MTASDGLSRIIARADAIRAADAPKAAFDLFAARMQAHGFPFVFAGRLSLALLLDLSPDPFAFVNADQPFVAGYLREGYFSDDPIMARARETNRPFRWREATEDLTPEQQRVVDAFHAAKMRYGLCVPIDRVRGVNGIVTLGRSSNFTLEPAALIEIEMLARILFETCDALFDTEGQRPVHLTQRERDVLTLVAQGKTNWEVGQILGVSEYSIRDYLRTLATKMQTTNRTHTVVRAMQLGLIAV